jgi:hypothetical protein
MCLPWSEWSIETHVGWLFLHDGGQMIAGCKSEKGDVVLLDGDGYVGISIHTTRGWKKSRAGGIADSQWEEDEELSWDGWLAQLRGKHISPCRDVG